MHMNTHTRFPSARRRGSVLIVALILSLIIGYSLASFLQLANSATRISYRTHYLGVAMNVAETGLEQAMWDINNSAGTWTGWIDAGAAGAHHRTFDLGTVEGGATAVVKVHAQEKTGSVDAWILSRAIISPTLGAPIEKWVKVTLDKRSTGAVGGLGKNGIVAHGSEVVMGSWNSDPDNDPSTPPIEYSDDVANDEMPLATISIDATLNSGNAKINGTASVGSKTISAILVGAQGHIGPFDTPEGTMDPDSVSANFSADVPPPEVPSGSYTSLGAVGSALTLPRAGDPDEDGVYYYTASEIDLNGSALVISAGADVVIHVTASGDAISLAGNGGAIQVQGTLVTDTSTGTSTYTTGKLAIYTAGDIKVTGQGAITNEITTQLYTPPVTVPTETRTTTTISNVQNVYGKGQQKDTVIGWSYTQTISVATTVDDTTTTTSPSVSNYKTLIESGGTEPVAGTTTTTTSADSTIPAITTDTGTYVGQANNLHIYGTLSDEDYEDGERQDIDISGNGNLSAVVYAPNADISAKGGGNSGFVYGSLVGNTLTFTGNDRFIYDESLGVSDDGARLGIDNWDEMGTSADRNQSVSYADPNTYASYMDF